MSRAHESWEIPTIIQVDPHGPAMTERGIHNRWHPEIPSVASVKPGQAFKVECMDFCGNSIRNNDCADDVLDFNWDMDHHLSGPINIETAMPGDVLAVEILDVSPFPNRLWGFSLIDPGLGPLDKPHTRVAKCIWDFHGITATSRHIGGVQFNGRPHCGVLGTAPSHELLKTWRTREANLSDRYLSHGHMFAQLPTENGAYIGQDLPPDLAKRIKSEGARTKPAREHGGNIDSGSLTRGSTIYLPIYVPGANFSVGDCHFSLGDGEPTCAVEMAGIATLKCTVIRNGMELFNLRSPMVLNSASEPLYRSQVIFHGISTDDSGKQHASCLTTSYVQAATHAMEYLGKLGYSHEQAHMLLACAPIETKVLACPNIPNANVSVGLPVEIFEDNIRPDEKGLTKKDRRTVAYLSPERERRWLGEFKMQVNPWRCSVGDASPKVLQ